MVTNKTRRNKSLKLEESIKQQLMGQKIRKVTYFELNTIDHPFYFDGFDNCDLAIDVEFMNGIHVHVGWKDNDHHEIGIGEYTPIEHLNLNIKIDATERWCTVYRLVCRI